MNNGELVAVATTKLAGKEWRPKSLKANAST